MQPRVIGKICLCQHFCKKKINIACTLHETFKVTHLAIGVKSMFSLIWNRKTSVWNSFVMLRLVLVQECSALSAMLYSGELLSKFTKSEKPAMQASKMY